MKSKQEEFEATFKDGENWVLQFLQQLVGNDVEV